MKGARTNVFGFGCNRPPQLHDKLLGVQANLNDVVQKSKERSQWEGGNKQSHHPKLNDYRNRQKERRGRWMNVRTYSSVAVGYCDIPQLKWHFYRQLKKKKEKTLRKKPLGLVEVHLLFPNTVLLPFAAKYTTNGLTAFYLSQHELLQQCEQQYYTGHVYSTC